MSVNELKDLRRSGRWRRFERIGVVIALLASLATVVGLFLEVRSERRVVEVQILSADQLTRLPSVSGLGGEFSYNGVPVTDLWRLRLRLANTGDATLVGQGPQSSLLGDSIPIAFPADVTILDASPEIGSFYVLTATSTNAMALSFTQWRQREDFEVIVYIAAEAPLSEPPFPLVPGRPIIEGDVAIHDARTSTADGPRRAIDYLPDPVAQAGKILGGLLAGLIGTVALGFLVVWSPVAYVRAQRWKFRYSDLFSKHLDTLGLNEDVKARLLKRPWRLNYASPFILGNQRGTATIRADTAKELSDKAEAIHLELEHFKSTGYLPWDGSQWKGFEGPRPNEPDFQTGWGTLFAVLIGLIIVGSCSAIIASMITL